jgi:hypothetical protein
MGRGSYLVKPETAAGQAITSGNDLQVMKR